VRRSIWISNDIWTEVLRRAEGEKADSAAAYVREAVIARIYYERAMEGDQALGRALGLAKRREKSS